VREPVVHILEDDAAPMCGFRGKIQYFIYARVIDAPSVVKKINYCKNCKRHFRRLNGVTVTP